MTIFYITEAFRSILHSKLASFITVISISIAILATNSSVILILLSNKIDDELKERVEVDIFLYSDVEQSQINNIGRKLRNDNRLQSVRFISKTDAERSFIEETGEDFKSILEANPLPPSFRVNFNSEKVERKTIEDFVAEMKNEKMVDDVVYDYSTIISLINFINSSRYIIFSISFVFIILAVYLVYSTNRLPMQQKSERFNTMKLVGAKLSTLKIPIYITGFLFGLIGAIISLLVMILLTGIIQKFYYNFNFLNYIYIATLIIAILGLFFGLLGSYISSRSINLKIKKLK